MWVIEGVYPVARVPEPRERKTPRDIILELSLCLVIKFISPGALEPLYVLFEATLSIQGFPWSVRPALATVDATLGL